MSTEMDLNQIHMGAAADLSAGALAWCHMVWKKNFTGGPPYFAHINAE